MSAANGNRFQSLVGFQHLRRVCGQRGRSPSCCYHDENPGKIGYGGGKCIKRHCPVWIDITEANATGEAALPARKDA